MRDESLNIWPQRRPITATKKPFKQEVARKAPWSYYEQWDEKKPDMYTASTRAAYQRYAPQPELRRPAFTIATGDEVGLPTVSKVIGLAELKARPLPYSLSDASDPTRMQTTASRAYSTPDLLRAKLEHRAGEAKDEDLPLGFSKTSHGLLPGKTLAGARFGADSTTYRSDMRRFEPMPGRAVPSFTLSWKSGIGQEEFSVQVPPSELNKAHFELGREPMEYVSAMRATHGVQQPGSGQQALPPFGAATDAEGERGTEYHIVHGGAPLPPSRYYEPKLPMQLRNTFKPEPALPRGQRYNTITGEVQRW